MKILELPNILYPFDLVISTAFGIFIPPIYLVSVLRPFEFQVKSVQINFWPTFF